MSRANWNPFIAKSLVLLASVTLTLALAEAILRVFRYDPLRSMRQEHGVIYRPSPVPDLKYELTPDISARLWGIPMEINADGYRGRMATPGKFQGYRILVLGDSITLGTGLTEEFTYPYQLHNILNDQAESRYEVLNFGVGGYDTLQEVALLENRGLIYRPNLVIIGYCLNDIGIDSLSLEYLERVRKYREDPLFRLRLAQFVATRLDRILLRNWVEMKNRIEEFKRSYAGQIAQIGKGEYEIRELMRRSPSQFPSSWYQSEERIGRLRYAFQRLAATARRNNLSVMVAVIPWLEENAGSYPHFAANKIVELEANRAGFAAVDLTPEFLRAGMRRLRRIDSDHCHPSAAGQRIIAESLAAQIRGMGLQMQHNPPGR